MIAIGPDNFPRHAGRLPSDGRAFPYHALRAQPAVLMGLLASGTMDFFGAQTVAVLPYEQYLKRFPAISSNSHGEQRQACDAGWIRVDMIPGRSTGASRNNGQHSFYQLIHQARGCSLRFHRFAQTLNPLGRHHDMLLANVFAQTERWPRQNRRGGQGGGTPTGSCRTGS